MQSDAALYARYNDLIDGLGISSIEELDEEFKGDLLSMCTPSQEQEDRESPLRRKNDLFSSSKCSSKRGDDGRPDYEVSRIESL